jgi:hypothetical protein
LLDKLTSWNHPGFESENIIINNFLNLLKDRLLALNNKNLSKIIFLLDAGFYRTNIIKYLLKLKLPFIINAIGDRDITFLNKETGEKIETKLHNLEKGYYEIKHLRKQLTVAVYFEKNKDGQLEKESWLVI